MREDLGASEGEVVREVVKTDQREEGKGKGKGKLRNWTQVQRVMQWAGDYLLALSRGLDIGSGQLICGTVIGWKINNHSSPTNK